MELATLGFDSWFEERAAGLGGTGRAALRVTTVDRGAYLVQGQDGASRAELAGRLRLAVPSPAERPCVGDWVVAERSGPDSPAIIHAVLPRRTFLRRKCAGKLVDYQMIAANIDTAFIVQDCLSDFNVRRLSRYLVMTRDGGIEPQVVLSKTDLVTTGELDHLVGLIRCEGITAPVIAISNATGAGLDDFRGRLAAGRTYCLLGSSGVGKSSLINRLLGREALETRIVSGTGEGVHTTSRRQLCVLDGGAMLIDTPGMRELGLLGTEEGLGAAFADIEEYARQCRFPDCTHAHEPGCAVRRARETGELADSRHEEYLKLQRESDHHALSYAGRRRKDKAFGRFIKTAKAQLKERGRG